MWKNIHSNGDNRECTRRRSSKMYQSVEDEKSRNEDKKKKWTLVCFIHEKSQSTKKKKGWEMQLHFCSFKLQRFWYLLYLSHWRSEAKKKKAKVTQPSNWWRSIIFFYPASCLSITGTTHWINLSSSKSGQCAFKFTFTRAPHANTSSSNNNTTTASR